MNIETKEKNICNIHLFINNPFSSFIHIAHGFGKKMDATAVLDNTNNSF